MTPTLALLATLLLASAGHAKKRENIPVFSYNQLQQDLQEDNLWPLKVVGKNLGAFAVSNTNNSPEYHQALAGLRKEAKLCLEANAEQVHVATLTSDVKRSTSARASSDPTSGHPACLTQLSVLEKTFDQTGFLVQKIIAKLSEKYYGADVSYYSEKEANQKSLIGTDYLDHIHVYRNQEAEDDDDDDDTGDDDDDDFVAPIHTDNGLFLLLTPHPDEPLLVKNSNGDMLTTVEGDVVVLYGRALQEWLHQDVKRAPIFRAAPHALPEVEGERVVFARMYIAPEDAVTEKNKGLTTFGSMFHGVDHSTMASDQCLHSVFLSAQRDMCEEGFAYCWMGCMPIDQNCPQEGQVCYGDGMAPCCTEGQTPEEDNCEDMNGTCAWHCQASN